MIELCKQDDDDSSTPEPSNSVSDEQRPASDYSEGYTKSLGKYPVYSSEKILAKLKELVEEVEENSDESSSDHSSKDE